MLRSLNSIPLLLLLSFPAVAEHNRLISVQSENRCSIHGNLGKRIIIAIDVEMAAEKKASPEEQEKVDADPGWLKGRDLTIWQPVRHASIEVNGIPVLIPQSAFEDLYSVNFMSIREKSGIMILELSGGDAGGSYTTKFRIQSSRRMKGHYFVSERVYRSGEFPDEVWEKTTYHNQIWDNPKM